MVVITNDGVFSLSPIINLPAGDLQLTGCCCDQHECFDKIDSYLVPYLILHAPKMLNQLYMCSRDNRMFQEHAMLCINRVHCSQSVVADPRDIHVSLPSCDVN